MNKKFSFLVALAMCFTMSVGATSCDLLQPDDNGPSVQQPGGDDNTQGGGNQGGDNTQGGGNQGGDNTQGGGNQGGDNTQGGNDSVDNDDPNVPDASIVKMSATELAAINAQGLILTGTSTSYTLDVGYVFSIAGGYEDLANSDYRNWNADFFVSFDNDVEADTIILAGQYDTWGENWEGFLVGVDIESDDKIQLLASADVTVSCEEVYELVQEFQCGVTNLSEENEGTTMTVELRLFNPENPDEYVWVSVTTYTF